MKPANPPEYKEGVMKNSFYDIWTGVISPRLDEAIAKIESAGPGDVLAALERTPATQEGFFALLSEMPDNLADMAQAAARRITEQRFGGTVNLYIPLYLSNHCVNNCAYCWFAKSNPARRTVLTIERVEKEAALLRGEGYRSILLVSGEDPARTGVEFIADCVRLVKRMGFVFVGLEAEAMETAEYRHLAQAGLDSVTVYQETYDPAIYAEVHPSGPKKDYRRRMETPRRAAMAGIRSVGMGVLLGLADWRREAVALALHVKHMQKYHGSAMVSISFPRIHSAPGGFVPSHPVSNGQFIRMIAAMRLAFPDSTLTLSTREAPDLRDRLFGMGINQVSAGSRTSPGAYTQNAGAEEQFPVADERTPAQVASAIRSHGLEWVFKDWDPNMAPAPMKEDVADGNHP